MKPSIFQFNQYERDQFVKTWAESLPTGSRVLDVGAGTCRYKSFFDHCHYAAQDFAQYSDENWVYGQLDYVCDAASIPAESSSFDAILCTEVLEHVPEPIRVIAEIARLLRPGGRLLLTAPLGSGLHQEPYHFYGGYTLYWYQKFLTEYGFRGITVTPNGGFFKHYGQESQRFSAILDPRRRSRGVLLTLFWLLTLPWFRLVLPILCHWLDKLDTHRAFTVGYFVTAIRQ